MPIGDILICHLSDFPTLLALENLCGYYNGVGFNYHVFYLHKLLGVYIFKEFRLSDPTFLSLTFANRLVLVLAKKWYHF